MPELPEVEVTRRSLEQAVIPRASLKKIEIFRPKLRYPIPKKNLQILIGLSISRVRRKGKFLLLDIGEFTVISHLGMSGSWRFQGPVEPSRHDHVVFHFDDGSLWIYRDPRRFGFLDVVRSAEIQNHPMIKRLGAEPLNEPLDFMDLWPRLRAQNRSIRNVLMDQSFIAGLGNIYVSEILFLAKVHPEKQAHRLSEGAFQRLLEVIPSVLARAVEKGGSTLRDHVVSATGESGLFQNEHQVYGREGQVCVVCATGIRRKTLGGRSVFWCPVCQKR